MFVSLLAKFRVLLIFVIIGSSSRASFPAQNSNEDKDGNGLTNNQEPILGMLSVNPETLNIGLVGMYTFDDGTANDSSGNHNNGVASNTLITNGVQGNALRFNGINSVVEIPTLIPQYTVQGTIFGWYRANPNPDLSVINAYGNIAAAYQTMFGQNRAQNDYAPGLFVTLWNRSEVMNRVYDPMGYTIRAGYSDEYPANSQWHDIVLEPQPASPSAINGDWHSIAATIATTASGKTLKLYYDGIWCGTTSCGNPDNEAVTDAEFCIGGSADPSFASSSFNGDIDNVYVYDRTLGDDEILALHLTTASAASPDTDSPVITLLGMDPMEVYKGSAFNDPGATVTDNVDATRTIMGSGTVDMTSVGIYTLTYTAQDAAGNLAVPVTRTVNVVLDPNGDEDGDGLTNGAEILGGTNPLLADTDGDGVKDGAEVAAGTSPLSKPFFRADAFAVTFNGRSTQRVIFPRPVQDDFTLSFWVNTTSAGSGSVHWYQGIGLLDGEVGGVTNDFGTALMAGGRVGFGVGNPDITLISERQSTTTRGIMWWLS